LLVVAYFSVNIARQMNEPVWDAELGVWQGEMAAGLDLDILPSPLYVFGYGSLIWNPGPYLKNFSSYHCSAIGWKRLFAQRSCDHRGTVLFPGLVLNLVDDDCLKELNYLDKTSSRSECLGMIWYVPVDAVAEVVADLDYRERGGYHRQIVQVKLQEDTTFHKTGELVSALVYTGPQSNPNFFLERSNRFDVSTNMDVFGFSIRNNVVDIITAAIGPSGANVDYLFNLERFLHERGMVDEYLVQLADCVRRRVGPWIARRNRRHLHASVSTTLLGKKCFLSGWGSNEFMQLRSSLGGESEYLNDLHAHHHWATRLADRSAIDSEFRDCTLDNHVSAGGGTSATVDCNGTLTMWGKLVPLILQHAVAPAASAGIVHIEGVDCVSIGHDHCLMLLHSGHVVGFGSNSHGQLLGPEEVAGEERGFYIRQSDIQLKQTSHDVFRIQSSCPLQRKMISSGESPRVAILKLAVGLRHSAAITADGRLLTWGDVTHSQCLGREEGVERDSAISWSPPGDATRLIDVACGARFTLVVDSSGCIYSLGSDKHACLGRNVTSPTEDCEPIRKRSEIKSSVPGAVCGLPSNVRWQRVVCGWSHAVARGIRSDGSLVFWTWGRCDMGQCLTIEASGSLDGQTPRQVRPLPGGAEIAEVWAGAEFTVVCDSRGAVWGCGWNEHGNLGNGDVHCRNVLDEWQPSVEHSVSGDSRQVQLASVWEGALSCGGGHVLSIEKTAS
jgi:cation transport regulator ChaC/alpha-tubulin suppressor-like RCC1 family protein